MAGSQSDRQSVQARNLAKLVYLLQLLTLLFGITTVIGILINHTRRDSVSGTLAQSHFLWQILTFWISLGVVVMGFLVGGTIGQYLYISAVVWLYYRAIKGFLFLRIEKEAPTY